MNLILSTDSYKLTHWKMYPPKVRFVHSYLEPRTGEGYQNVVWAGLQGILHEYFSKPVTQADVHEAYEVAKNHFGSSQHFNFEGWQLLVDRHNGRLPVKIMALPEGSVVQRGTPVLTIENTDPDFPWLTNVLETLLMHVWYPSTVATVSKDLRDFLNEYPNLPAPQFMVHDFGYRGVSSDQSASRGGFGHLLSFMGTDTLAAMQYVRKFYGQQQGIAYSVSATEHSIMTQYGQAGEEELIKDLIDKHPNQILSIVADSYDYYKFVHKLQRFAEYAQLRGTKLVIRPDSPTPTHPDPIDLIRWTLANLPKSVNVLWGDGLNPQQIKNIIKNVYPEDRPRLVFGMGGGLLQKVNRDTLRWAMKCSAVSPNGTLWQSIQKNPLDQSKASKPGRQDRGMIEIYRDGLIKQQWNLDEIRKRVVQDDLVPL
jgi:nicotinamide phosphoribosyltransferase